MDVLIEKYVHVVLFNRPFERMLCLIVIVEEWNRSFRFSLPIYMYG